MVLQVYIYRRKNHNTTFSLATLLLFYEFNENAEQIVTDYEAIHIGTLGISQYDLINDPLWTIVFKILMGNIDKFLG